MDIFNEEANLPFYQVWCKQCGALGPDKPTIWKAINAWNRRELLTTEQEDKVAFDPDDLEEP